MGKFAAGQAPGPGRPKHRHLRPELIRQLGPEAWRRLVAVQVERAVTGDQAAARWLLDALDLLTPRRAAVAAPQPPPTPPANSGDAAWDYLANRARDVLG